MFAKRIYSMVMAFLLTIGLTCFSTASAETIAQVELMMESNYVKSDIINLKEDIGLYVTVKSEKQSQSWLRYTVSYLKPFPMVKIGYLPETVKEDFIAPGDEKSFPLNLKSGKYQIALHSEDGNCKGTAAISDTP